MFRLLCASFPLLRTRSGRYIFVPNEPCPFFKYAKSREARLPMPKSTFRIAFDNNFVPTELANSLSSLSGYPFLRIRHMWPAGDFLQRFGSGHLPLLLFCVCFHGATGRTEDGLVNARDQ